MEKPTVAVIGASTNRAKFGNKSVRAHAAKGYQVYPVNPSAKQIEGFDTYPDIDSVPTPLDRVSMYVTPDVGLTMLESIAGRKPKELWLNPGTESESLIRKGREMGLNVIVGCSIVELGLSPAQFPDQ